MRDGGQRLSSGIHTGGEWRARKLPLTTPHATSCGHSSPEAEETTGKSAFCRGDLQFVWALHEENRRPQGRTELFIAQYSCTYKFIFGTLC